MIILGQNGLPYAKRLARELSEYHEGVKHYNFLFKQFGNGEYLVDVIGYNGEASSSGKLKRLARDIENDGKILAVVQGEYGGKWNSDHIVGKSKQIADVLKEDDIEYRAKLPKPEKLGVLWTHSPFAKQDKLFADDNGNPMYAVPKTIKMMRRDMKRCGVDILFEIFPHDYRREGWIYKKAPKNALHKVYTDWGKLPELEKARLVTVEDWRNFAWAIDPTALIAEYIRTNIPADVIVSPDFTADAMSINISKELGVWNEALQKQRSRKDGKITLKNHLKEELVEGKNVIITDDMVYTGRTLFLAAKDAYQHGAQNISFVVVHGQLTGDAEKRIKESGIGLYTADTIVNPFARIRTPKRVAESVWNVQLNHPEIF